MTINLTSSSEMVASIGARLNSKQAFLIFLFHTFSIISFGQGGFHIPYLADNLKYGLISSSGDTICQPLFETFPNCTSRGIYYGWGGDNIHHYLFKNRDILTLNGNQTHLGVPKYLTNYLGSAELSSKGYYQTYADSKFHRYDNFSTNIFFLDINEEATNTVVIWDGKRLEYTYYNVLTKIQRKENVDWNRLGFLCFTVPRYSISQPVVSWPQDSKRFCFGYMPFFKEDKTCVLLDTNLNIVLDKKYRDVMILDKKKLLVCNWEKDFTIVDYNGNPITKSYNFPVFPLIGSVNLLKREILMTNNDDFSDCRYQLIHPEGSLAHNDAFNSIYQVDDSVLLALNTNDKYGLIDLNGKEILPFEYSSIMPYTRGMYIVEIFSATGQLISRQKFDAEARKFMPWESTTRIFPTVSGRYSTINHADTTYLFDQNLNEVYKCYSCDIECLYPQNSINEIRFTVRDKITGHSNIFDTKAKFLFSGPIEGRICPRQTFGKDYFLFSSQDQNWDSHLGIIDSIGRIILQPIHKQITQSETNMEQVIAISHTGAIEQFDSNFNPLSKEPKDMFSSILQPVIFPNTANTEQQQVLQINDIKICINPDNTINWVESLNAAILKTHLNPTICSILSNGSLLTDEVDPLTNLHLVKIYSSNLVLLSTLYDLVSSPEEFNSHPQCLRVSVQIANQSETKRVKHVLVNFYTGKQYRY